MGLGTMDDDRSAAAGLPFGADRSDLDRSPLEVEQLLSSNCWRELRTFLAVAKGRSYARAGEMLQMSAPTVSRDIKRLQSLFGSQLVIATHSGTVLTSKGRELAIHLADLDFRLYSLAANLRQEQSAIAGQVSVSVTSGLSVAFVAPAVARLTREHPRIRIDLKEQMSFIDLDKNQTDVMLGLMPIQRADVHCEKVGVLHLIPVAARSYIEAEGVPTRQGAHSHRFIQCSYYVSETPFWQPWNDLLDSGTSHVCENSLAYFSLIKSGAGIGLLGNYVLIEPHFVPVDLGVHLAMPLYVIALRDRLRSKPVRVVLDWLRAIFTQNVFFADRLNLTAGASAPENDFRAFFNLAPNPPSRAANE